MDFIKKNRTYIGVIVIGALGIWVYMTYFGGSSSSATLTSSQQDSPLSQDVLITLSNLHTIHS
jgi:hypothetical protein